MYGFLLVILATPYIFDIQAWVLEVIVVGTTGVGFVYSLTLSWLLGKLIGPFVKVMADVFRYLSEFKYRERLDQQLRKKLSGLELDRESTLVVVGHSLGSVVAAHFFLYNSDVLSAMGPVRFVTLGSPLVRFFHRFFPDFCPHPAAALDVIRQEKPDFRWFNVYRPWDPVGTSFGQCSLSGIRELPTSQRWRVLLAAHTNYWTDPCVLGIIRSELAGVTAENPLPRAAALLSGQRKTWFREYTDWGFSPLLLNWLALAFTALVIVWLYYSALYLTPRVRQASRE
jgi:hypothetical protein